MDLYTIKGQAPKSAVFKQHYKDKHNGKEKGSQDSLTQLFMLAAAKMQQEKDKALRLTTEAEVVEDGPEATSLEEAAAAEEGDEEMLCDIPVLELGVIQQVGNTCTPRALITALESLNSAKELEATGPRFKDIDEKTEGEGSAWLETHLDACDVYSRIVVVENLSMITSTVITTSS